MIPFWKKTDKHSKPQSAQKRRQNAKPAVPRTAQQSIPMQRMFEDGTCRVKPNYYTRTIQYQDINYQLAQQEDKTAIFEEWDAHCTETRVEADAETTVSVEEYRIFAVFLQVLLISEEHRNLHTVLAGEKHLFRYEVVRVELHFRGTVQFVAVLVHIIFIGSAGNGERCLLYTSPSPRDCS